jgi:hypothetical protein
MQQHVLRRGEHPAPRITRAQPPRVRLVARPPTLEELEARLLTEDETPVENMFSEKERRLLPGSLHSGWSGPPPGPDGAPRPFVAISDVGLFFTLTEAPLVPDVLVSLDVRPTGDELAHAAQARAERLAAKLRAMGIDDDD